MFDWLSTGNIILIISIILSLAIYALIIFDIFYTGKYAPNNARITWLLLVILLPLTGIGSLVLVVYGVYGHRSLKNQSIKALEEMRLAAADTPAGAINPADTDVTARTPQTVAVYSQQQIKNFKDATAILGGFAGFFAVVLGLAPIAIFLFSIVLFLFFTSFSSTSSGGGAKGM